MRGHSARIGSWLPACSSLALLMTALGGTGAAAGDPALQQGRLEEMRAKGAQATLTVLPVNRDGTPSTEVADALGLALETAGVARVEIAGSAFMPPSGAGFAQASALFGEWVRGNPIATDYALYVEVGPVTPSGEDELRGLVVDRSGELVWTDTVKTGARKKDVPPVVGRYSLFLQTVERLGTVLGLVPASSESGKGHKFLPKVGRADEEEGIGMARRLLAMRKAAGAATLEIYPLLVNGEPDEGGAAELAARLTNEKLVSASCPPGQAPLRAAAIPFPPGLQPEGLESDVNQVLGVLKVRRLWDQARAFEAHVRAHPPAGGYAALFEYVIEPGKKSRASLVNLIVCDRAGQLVIVDHQGESSMSFRRKTPDSLGDCSELVVTRMDHHLRGVEWIPLSDEIAAGRDAGKPILYFFTAEWCAPCYRLEDEVFYNRSMLNDFSKMFVAVRVLDRKVEEGQNPRFVATLEQYFGVKAFPTLAVVLPTGAVIGAVQGFSESDVTWRWLRKTYKKAMDEMPLSVRAPR